MIRLLFAAALLVPQLCGYSVLTHEEIIDLSWDDQLKPLLLQHYPNATPENLREAHAYAYGGSVIQDLGYYPFGSKLFSDLTHYVRTGDFTLNLLHEAKDINEYAFALGALAHYTSDIHGHPAVNRAVALEYPKLRAKFGDIVTYAQSHTAHIRIEFGFDVTQVAKGRYTAESYRDFIGFEVSKPVLERAFEKTYGVPLHDVMAIEDLAIGSYRRAVSGLIPELTKVAVQTNQVKFAPEKRDAQRQAFLYHLSRADYEKSWGKEYHRPGVLTRILTFLFRLVPKIGPFKALSVKAPTAQTEDLYFKSINETVTAYHKFLDQEKAGTLKLENMDLDTGHPTKPGEYPLADKTLAKLRKKTQSKS